MSSLKVIYIHINLPRCLATLQSRDHWNKSNLAQRRTKCAFKITVGGFKSGYLVQKELRDLGQKYILLQYWLVNKWI